MWKQTLPSSSNIYSLVVGCGNLVALRIYSWRALCSLSLICSSPSLVVDSLAISSIRTLQLQKIQVLIMIRHPFLLPFLALSFVCIIGLAGIAQAQNQTQATTDPDEGTAFSLSPLFSCSWWWWWCYQYILPWSISQLIIY